MKKYGTVIALGFAVVFGALAVMLVNKWMTSQEVIQQVAETDDEAAATLASMLRSGRIQRLTEEAEAA